MSITDQKAALRKGLIGARPASRQRAAQYDFMAQTLRQKLPADAFQMTAYLPIRRELDPLPLIEPFAAFPLLCRAHPRARPAGLPALVAGEPLDEGLVQDAGTAETAPKLAAKPWSCCCLWSALTKAYFGLGMAVDFMTEPSTVPPARAQRASPSAWPMTASASPQRCPWSRRTKAACRHYTPTSGLRRRYHRT